MQTFSYFYSWFSHFSPFSFHLEYDEVNHFSLGIERKDISSHIASYYDPLYATFEWQSGEKKISFFICCFFCNIFWFHFFVLFLSFHLSHSFCLCLCLSRPGIRSNFKGVHQFIEWMKQDWGKLFKRLCVIFVALQWKRRRTHKKGNEGWHSDIHLKTWHQRFFKF